jgi:hypothetical protein
VVEEELEAAERGLSAPAQEVEEVGRPKESVLVDGAEDREIAGSERYAANRRALETRPADLRVGHWN